MTGQSSHDSDPLNWVGNIIWARELDTKKFKPVEWLIDGILPAGGLGIIAGKSKIGKSWLVLHIALCVAGGLPAFGRIQTKKSSVLYLALEDNERRLQDRIRKLIGPDEIPEALGMFTEWVTVDDGCFGRIELFLEFNPDCRLIIIDTFGKIRGRPDSRNSSVYQQDYKDMGAFKTLADKHNVSILLVHHTRKQDASDALDLVSGSTGLVGAADTIMVLTRPRGDPDGKFIVTGRDIKDDVEQAARFDKETGQWTLLGPASEVTQKNASEKIRDFLSDSNQPAQATEISDTLGIKLGTVRSSLNRGEKDFGFEKLSRGLWGLHGKFYT